MKAVLHAIDLRWRWEDTADLRRYQQASCALAETAVHAAISCALLFLHSQRLPLSLAAMPAVGLSMGASIPGT